MGKHNLYLPLALSGLLILNELGEGLNSMCSNLRNSVNALGLTPKMIAEALLYVPLLIICSQVNSNHAHEIIIVCF